jgi:hypothetical protein
VVTETPCEFYTLAKDDLESILMADPFGEGSLGGAGRKKFEEILRSKV